MEDTRSTREKISGLVSHYAVNRKKLSEEQLQDIRSTLAIGWYKLVEEEFEPLVLDIVELEAELARVDRRVFETTREKLLEAGNSKAQATELARRLYKGDEEFIEATKKFNLCKRKIESFKELRNSSNHILNSLSYRKA